MDAPFNKSIHLLKSYKEIIKYFLAHRRQLEDDLKKHQTLDQILKQELIETFFQPIINLQTGMTLGYESLNRPQKTEIFDSTEYFYDFIGQSSKVFEMEKLCRTLAIQKFVQQTKNKEEDLLLFINVNPKVLSDPHFAPGKTLDLLNANRIKPQQIVLEVTEKDAVHNYEAFIKVLNYYREQGFRIAVDDAGSGYNSLKTIVLLQPEFVKIDRSIIQGVAEQPFQQEMVHLLLDYANRVQTKVVAEGIEVNEDYMYLKKLGIHYAQGYYISKPGPLIENVVFQPFALESLSRNTLLRPVCP